LPKSCIYFDTKKNFACEILAPSAVAFATYFHSRECASSRSIFCYIRKFEELSYIAKKRKFNFFELPLTLLIFFRIYLFAPCLFTTMRAFQASCCMHMHCNKIFSNSRYKSIRTIFAFIKSYGSFTLTHYIHTNS